MANPQNLRPFPKGKSGNPAGRPKGIKNWATVVQSILADEKLLDKVVTTKPSYWDELPTKNGANAVVIAMMINAMAGDKQAAEWLRKTGFGDKLTVESEDGLFKATKLEIEIVKSEDTNVGDSKS
jgi:hypothetical protein